MQAARSLCAILSFLSCLCLPSPGLAAAAVSGGGGGGAGARAPGRARSVLFYLIDTFRADQSSVYGNPRPTTPFLEEMAARGVVFENSYSQAPWTKPSMASILTSHYPSETGIARLFQRLSDDFVLLPEVMRDHGLYTVGLSANPLMGPVSNYTQGFAEFVGAIEINGGDALHRASGSAKLLNDHLFPWLASTHHWPMFLYVHAIDPHETYEPAEPYRSRFADASRMESFRAHWRALLSTRPPVPGLHLTKTNFERAHVAIEPFIEQGRNLYDADLLATDAQIRRLFAKLEQDGWGDDFVFVLTSDHGEEFFEHGGTSHGYTLYQEMIHVPLILVAPGLLPQGLRIESPVQSIDIYPTLCDLLGIDPPPGTRGRSLLPLIRNPEAPRFAARAVYAEKAEDPKNRRMGEASGVAKTVIEGRWKFILNFKSATNMPVPRDQLFDLDSDPGETKNVAGEHPKLVARLEKQVMAWTAERLAERRQEAQEQPPADPAVLQQLRELGYVR